MLPASMWQYKRQPSLKPGNAKDAKEPLVSCDLHCGKRMEKRFSTCVTADGRTINLTSVRVSSLLPLVRFRVKSPYHMCDFKPQFLQSIQYTSCLCRTHTYETRQCDDKPAWEPTSTSYRLSHWQVFTSLTNSKIFKHHSPAS